MEAQTRTRSPIATGMVGALLVAATCACQARQPQPAPGAAKPLLPTGAAAIRQAVSTQTPDDVTFAPGAAGNGVDVTCKPGKSDYPGIVIKPTGAAWDLSAFGHVDAKITNTGADPLTVCVRVDNAGDWSQNPWSAENGYPKPGETVTIRVYFGYSWGNKGYALDPAKVNEVLLFTNKSAKAQSFRVESLVAAGPRGEKPPVKPEDVRIAPRGGVILGPGMDTAEDSRTVLRAPAAAADTPITTTPVRVRLPQGSADAMAVFKPPLGLWDLRDYLQVVVTVRNAGAGTIVPRARLANQWSMADWVSGKSIAPGSEGQIVLPFAGPMAELSADGKVRGGSAFDSDRAGGIAVGAEGDGERTLEVASVRASVPPAPSLPAWLGKRPPVEGRWRQTMDEEFSGAALNDKLWTIYHPNYWDKASHFSKQNVIFGDGMVRLRFEKKRGHADDDPAKPETDYATGFITGTHKWTQRYGYFECRQKLPRAPGMWPAFWMMPDRGPDAGAAREDTRNGGMEFDILEYLARYGPYRYNIACHWDGYEKDHKSTGTEKLYVQPDKDGFYTAGLLWEPGSVTWYCNGQPIAQWKDPRVSSVPMYILFTAVSGGWGGNNLTGEGLPSDYVLDYVRAWQREP